MAEKWRVLVTVGNPHNPVAHAITQRLPPDTSPVYMDFSGDPVLSVVRVTVEADSPEDAHTLAETLVKQACLASEWNWTPVATGAERAPQA